MKGSNASRVIVLQALAIVALMLLLWWRWASPPGASAAAAKPSGAAAGAAAVPAAPAGADDDAPAGAGAPGAGETGVVRLSAQVQQASGLRSAALSAARAPAQGEAWGEVLAAQGLADARLRLRQAVLDVAQWDPALARAQHESERLDALWQDGGNVAHKLVDQAHAEQAQLEARQAAAQSLLEAVRASVRAEWGAAMLAELEQADGGALAGVLAGQQRLLLLAADRGERAEVTLAGHPDSAIPVQRLAPATQSVAGSSQPSWYWRAPAAALRAGQRVRMALGSPTAAAGVRVPESAVVWQAGQAWVYLPEDAEHFRRQAVTLEGALPGGWFAGAPLAPGRLVVVQGAQLLLSEESKALIRNENGD